MFALILVMTFNSVTHESTYQVAAQGFKTQAACEYYATSRKGQAMMQSVHALAYTCDTLKKDR